MPYWKRDEKRYDVDGRVIHPGDIVEKVGPEDPWRYHFCNYEHSKDLISIRCQNANNIGMCDVSASPCGSGANVRVLGHWMNHPGILDRDDLENGLGIPFIAQGIGEDLYLLKIPT